MLSIKVRIKSISKIIHIPVFLAIVLLSFSLLALSLPRVAGADDCGSAGCSPNSDLAFDTEDLNFILEQIKIAERHAAGEELIDILPNASLPLGLRTVDGSFNNLIEGQTDFGQADLEFPASVERVFSDAQNLTFPLAPNDVVGASTSYNQGDGRTVQDSTPRLISHLIVNQSVNNPAAVFAAEANGEATNVGPGFTGVDQLLIPNIAPDEGLSSPFNAFMTFFGQFFDHGLDLVNKGGNGLVYMPLQPDDPLYVAGGNSNFMLMTRASRDAGPDGIIGTEDDVSDPINATTPHVDQQQTYASHSSSQVLLRHYEVRDGRLQNSGHLLDGFGTDGLLDTADDGGMATWDTVQLQALEKFGIILDDFDGVNVPMIAADQYGNFIPGPVGGLPQLVIAGTPNTLVEGNLTTPVDATQAIRVNQSFFLDVAHSANPGGKVPDVDSVINPRIDSLSGQTIRGIRAGAEAGSYDDELLGVHFMCGDGRCNENIALTTIHTIFHREHNRLIDLTKRVLLDAGDLVTLNEWLDTPATQAQLDAWLGLPFATYDASLFHQEQTRVAVEALNLDWNGQRMFQAGRFGTEMQYNRIVFDEFAPTLAGLKDVFTGFHTSVDPSIGLEFSQSVYRFGHSMLTQTVDRFDADFNPLLDDFSQDASQLGLFEAFLNPLALYNSNVAGEAQLSPEVATGAVVRGITRTRANEIDEFVAGALQNNLVGLPLDLGAINIARSRDVGNPRLNAARRKFFTATQDNRLLPYAHWADYADNLRHEPSLVNFIAAYGTHPTLAGPDGIIGNADDPSPTFSGRRSAACAIVGALTTLGDLTPDPAQYCIDNGFGTPPAAPADALAFLFSTEYVDPLDPLNNRDWSSDTDGVTITGLDDVDFWNGGLAEERMPFGGILGSTHNFVFETQIESLQNGDRFYYVGRTANIHLFSELESNPFTSLVMRNTDMGEAGAGALSLNIFSVPNHILEVDQSEQFNATGDGTTADPTGDAELTPLVIRNADQLTTNVTVSDTTRVIQYTGGDHVTIGGTTGDDTIIAGIGDDTITGGGGNDRIEGGDGNDHIEGGGGDDIITDLSGFDVIEGGDGNDAISSGNGEDGVFGDAGNDFLVNTSEFALLFGGLGNDFILDGISNSHTRGGAGDDWMENLGGGEDLFQADNGAAAEGGEPLIKGNDVFIGHDGNNDADMESGDDIVVDGPGIERTEGQLGFDWISFQNDKLGVEADLNLKAFERPQLPPSNSTVLNRYDRVEGMSGSALADILIGTDNRLGDDRGSELVNFALIDGLDSLVPLSERRDLEPDVLTGEPQSGWTGGEIILGGAGSDLLIGNGGDDIIDGDASLAVAIQTPDPAIRSGAEWAAFIAAQSAFKSATSQAAADAKAAAAFVEAGVAAQQALDAAEAAATAAIEAANAADAALTNDLTITNELGVVITNTAPDAITQATWQTFLDSCSALLLSLDLELQVTTADTAAEAVAAQAEAVANQIASSQTALEAKAAASAAALLTAQADLVTAQAALPADAMVLVPGMQDVMDAVFSGLINPGELSISRVIDDADVTDTATDTAVFTGNRANYLIDSVAVPGFVQVTDTRTLPLTRVNDGRDLLRNIERLQFADQILVIDVVAPINSPAVGQPTISGITDVGFVLTASIAGVTDADNVSAVPPGSVDPAAVSWTWQSELDPGTGDFTPIVRELGLNGNGDPVTVRGETMTLTTDEAGLLVRVVGRFQDEELVFETVTSASVLIQAPPPPPPPVGTTLEIVQVRFAPNQGRLRVDGNVSPVTSIVTLFAPGTVNATGTACLGTNAGINAPVNQANGNFLFDSGNAGLADPITVCVESDAGLAVGGVTP